MTPSRVNVWLSGLVAAVILAPVAVLFMLSLSADVDLAGQIAAITVNSLALALLTVLGSVAIGVPLALVTSYADLPGRRFWVATLSAPLAVPSYLGAFAFFAAFGPGGELSVLSGLPLPPVKGLAGATLVMTLYTFPFVLLSTRAALAGLDVSVLEAARTLGMPLPTALWKVVLPRVRNGIAAGALLVALYTLSDFGTPALLQLDTFTRVIFVEYNAFGLDRAALLSLQLLGFVALILLLESRLRASRERPGRTMTLKLPGAIKVLCLVGASVIVLAALALPVAIFTLWLVRDGAVGFDPGYLLNSVYVSLLAAVATVLVALPVAFAASAGRLGRLFERITYLGFGIPGIVLGTALVYLGLQLSFLYQTVTLLVVAYMIRFLPLAVGAVRATLARRNNDLTGAARSLGASPFEVFRRISLPLSLPGLVAGAALVFLEAMRELPATLMLRPTGFETIGTYLWRTYEAGYFGRGAIPGLLLMLVSAVAVMMMVLGEGRLSRRHSR
ncbi:ABC transporter permease [Modicisalibacter zincidurans]|uniref:Iron ABC transporter permease n=1 Tax=Modicisalibacter zincidurans TaxID=1178777 RepID=A0ABP9RHA7_9GAMM|nr:iron ABC transporter permease [Halomonas zincidurans]